MSSGECKAITDLKSRLVRGYLLLAGAVAVVSVSFALTFAFMHHRDLSGHRADEVVIVVFFLTLVGLFAVGLVSAIRLALRFVKIHEELHQLTDDIAHDLRTPLTRLAAAAELTASGANTPLDLAETVGTETSSLLHLINTMLDLSRIGQGLDRVPVERVDLTELVRSLVDLYRPIAEDKGLALTAEFPEAEVRLSGQASRLRQMMQNLVDNAVKFTPSGGSVFVSLRTDEKGVAFTVRDTGCGIAREDAPHLFERFYRADASRELPGNGLGLALVKAVAVRHGGAVSLDVTDGPGASFTVRLPQAFLL